MGWRVSERVRKVSGGGAKGGVDDGMVCGVVRKTMEMKKKKKNGGSCRRCREI
jgi:hypothetical protein